jgi:hypothetical protein
VTTEEEWIYAESADGSARFVLGTRGDNPLVCFGINPSTAQPNLLDRTADRVRRAALLNGFDSFVILNVYPQRATNPDDLHERVDVDLKEANESHIAAVLGGRPVSVWAAWGALVEKRAYLSLLLRDIIANPHLEHARWFSRGELTGAGHPRHPLYVRSDAPLVPYSVDKYRWALLAVDVREEVPDGPGAAERDGETEEVRSTRLSVSLDVPRASGPGGRGGPRPCAAGRSGGPGPRRHRIRPRRIECRTDRFAKRIEFPAQVPTRR